MSDWATAHERMRRAFEANAADLLAYLERRTDPRSAAADVLGDAMETAWRKVRQLPSDPDGARMWLFVVARNTLLNQRRSLGRHRAAVERLRGVMISNSAPPTTDAEEVELRVTIQAALAELPDSEAEIVRLVNWDGFSLAEVAALEGIAPSTIRSRYAKALRSLVTLLRIEELAPTLVARDA
ncbi:RNA polymerase sigma factor [Schumannella soli]|uniref:RNA polymerase sigma factor n=1 Tax=Schumannella soli TaxID=2590779 RepID=A0A506YAE2_9MICO|nr:RNA polymerase sigma factor [Schumannella soli]TPW78077.1 RNA polymerase sigma factor [Schumannella soli]